MVKKFNLGLGGFKSERALFGLDRHKAILPNSKLQSVAKFSIYWVYLAQTDYFRHPSSVETMSG